MVEIIQELPRYRTDVTQFLVKHKGEFFVVSSSSFFNQFETLVFRADAKGEITDWCEVAGGRTMSRDEAIADLEGSV